MVQKLKKKTANLNTVAIRFPNHQVIKKILKKINFPLAMPSANLSSGLSPVTAGNVAEEFKKLDFIIDGGGQKLELSLPL